MIRLFQFPRALGLPNASPFCMKLETFLRMRKLEHRVHELDDPRKAPKGKLPFIEADGRRIGDSGLAMGYIAETRGLALDEGLSPERAAAGDAVVRMLEEHLYWVILYSRWMEPENFPGVARALFGALPFPVSRLVPALLRRKVKSQLWAQGTGRHARDEIYGMGLVDVRAASVLLGDKPYFAGDAPTRIDCTLYAFLANLLQAPVPSPLKTRALDFGNLLPYCRRMQEMFFPDVMAPPPAQQPRELPRRAGGRRFRPAAAHRSVRKSPSARNTCGSSCTTCDPGCPRQSSTSSATRWYDRG